LGGFIVAAIEFNGKKIYSRVLQAVPDVSETYVKSLINEALVELSQYDLKTEYAKTDLITNQMWYGLADDRAVTINRVYRCSILTDEGEYVRIPRLLQQDIKVTDTE
tara:strand:- start:661 stop:981 length:321 start_codon:yes stop_codon:yes gene_type:complete